MRRRPVLMRGPFRDAADLRIDIDVGVGATGARESSIRWGSGQPLPERAAELAAAHTSAKRAAAQARALKA